MVNALLWKMEAIRNVPRKRNSFAVAQGGGQTREARVVERHVGEHREKCDSFVKRTKIIKCLLVFHKYGFGCVFLAGVLDVTRYGLAFIESRGQESMN